MDEGSRHLSFFSEKSSSSLVEGTRISSASSYLLAQIVWFAIGTTLLIDTAYMIGHWSNLAVVILTSCLMTTSAWLSTRILVLLSGISIPFLFALMFVSWSGYLAEGYTTLSKAAEYVSELLLMIGACLGIATISSPRMRTSLSKTVAYACVASGCVIAVYAYGGSLEGMKQERTYLSLLPQLPYYTSYFLGLASQTGMHAGAGGLSNLNNMLSWKFKLPLPAVVLLIGSVCAVAYDYFYQVFCQNLPEGMKYLGILFYLVAFLVARGSLALIKKIARGTTV